MFNNRSHLSAILFAVLLTNCDSATLQVRGFPGLAVTVNCKPGGTIARYTDEQGRFPGERGPADSAFHFALLSTVGEPPLACGSRNQTAYRLVRTLALDPLDLVVHVSREESAYRATVATYNRETKRVNKSELTLDEAKWRRIEAALNALDYWNQPANEMPSPKRGGHLDGGWLALEGYAENHYHVVLRPASNDRLSSSAQVFFDTLNLQLQQFR